MSSRKTVKASLIALSSSEKTQHMQAPPELHFVIFFGGLKKKYRDSRERPSIIRILNDILVDVIKQEQKNSVLPT